MPVESLNQYVARVSTEAEVPGGYKFIEYRNELYGVLPKRGCNDCHGSGVVTRNGEESKCDCLWRRMFDARRLRPQTRSAPPAFLSNSPGMVDELKRRRVVLQKQLDEARAAVAGTQDNMDEELKQHDTVVEQATTLVEQADEAHRTVQADIEHLEKSIEYNKGRADELRAQARELENQTERDRITLAKRRSHDLHQALLERDRARKKIEKLAEEHNKISHRWHKQLRDPQRDLRRAEERLARIDKQITQLDVDDLAEPLPPPPAPPAINPLTARGLTVAASPLTAPPAPAPLPVTPPVTPSVVEPPVATPPAINRDPATGAALVDSLVMMEAGELPPMPPTGTADAGIRAVELLANVGPVTTSTSTPEPTTTPAATVPDAVAAVRQALGIPDNFATGATGPTPADELCAATAGPPAEARAALREVAQSCADVVADAHGLPPVTVTVPESK